MNDQQRAAMQMALEALEEAADGFETASNGGGIDFYAFAKGLQEDITALREALAQQQEKMPTQVGHESRFHKLESANCTTKPQENTARCSGCNKTVKDGWALYCVECWEKAQPQGEPVDFLQERIEQALTVDVKSTTPYRDYSAMSPLDCYEAGLLDASLAIRTEIKKAVKQIFEGNEHGKN